MDEALAALRLWAVAMLFMFLLLSFFVRELAAAGADEAAVLAAEASATEIERIMLDVCADPADEEYCVGASEHAYWNCSTEPLDEREAEVDPDKPVSQQDVFVWRRQAEAAGQAAAYAQLALNRSLLGTHVEVEMLGCDVRSTVEVGALGAQLGFLRATRSHCVRVRHNTGADFADDLLTGTPYGRRPLGCEGVINPVVAATPRGS